MSFRIKYATQLIEDDDKAAVLKAMDSENLTQGKFVNLFEDALCSYTKSKYCSVVANASVALKLAYMALDVKPGDIVWIANNTFASTATSALSCGARVVPIEISLDTFNFDVSKLKLMLDVAKNKKCLPKVVTVVDFGGLPSASLELHNLSKKYGFRVIIDSAHGIGSKIGAEPTGANTYSDITVFSFHAIKVITTGEGGALTTNDPELASKFSSLRSHGIRAASHRSEQEKKGELWNYDVFNLGYNFRLTDIQSALGLSQLKKLDRFVNIRHDLMKTYENNLASRFELQKVHSGFHSAYHLNAVLLPKNMRMNKRDIFCRFAEKSIQLNYHYIPINRLKFIEKVNGKTNMVRSNEYFRRAITLPLHQKLSHEDIKEICGELNKCK